MTAAPRDQLELTALRAEIDDVDRRIVALLDRRAHLVRALAPRKSALRLPAVDRERERAMHPTFESRPIDGLAARDLAALRAAARRVYRRIAAESAPA
ncbi:MAG: chorismate mutase [Planctomycetota bacterium]